MPSAYKTWIDSQPEHVQRAYRLKQKQWRIDNAAHVRRYQRKWRKANKEKITEYNREWRKKNPGRAK